MTYRIEQDFEYAGHDYWRWRAWIEAGGDELNQVVKVTWILHPTFKKPRVTIEDRTTKFRLQTAGWGTFLLRAELELKGGERRLLKRNLRLEYPETDSGSAVADRSSTASPVRPRTVFLSYSAEDNRTAATLRNELTRAGYEVLDQTHLDSGAYVRESFARMVSRADAVVGIVGESDISPWVRQEMFAAISNEKPTLAILMPGASESGLLERVESLRVDNSKLDSKAIDRMLSFVKAV